MNANEGLLRIAKAIRVLGYGFAALSLFIGIAIATNSNSSASERVGMFIASAVFAALIGAAGWGLAWIVEGFAKAKDA